MTDPECVDIKGTILEPMNLHDVASCQNNFNIGRNVIFGPEVGYVRRSLLRKRLSGSGSSLLSKIISNQRVFGSMSFAVGKLSSSLAINSSPPGGRATDSGVASKISS